MTTEPQARDGRYLCSRALWSARSPVLAPLPRHAALGPGAPGSPLLAAPSASGGHSRGGYRGRESGRIKQVWNGQSVPKPLSASLQQRHGAASDRTRHRPRHCSQCGRRAAGRSDPHKVRTRDASSHPRTAHLRTVTLHTTVQSGPAPAAANHSGSDVSDHV